jgi:hypothetical protein
VGELFRSRYGTHAGWAHSLAFAAELPAFRGALPEHIASEMAEARSAEKAERAAAKAAKKGSADAALASKATQGVATASAKSFATDADSEGAKVEERARASAEAVPLGAPTARRRPAPQTAGGTAEQPEQKPPKRRRAPPAGAASQEADRETIGGEAPTAAAKSKRVRASAADRRR